MEAQIVDLKQWKAAHPPVIVCWNAGMLECRAGYGLGLAKTVA